MVERSKWYVYVLFCLKNRSCYVGFTQNLKNRLTQHASGVVRSTSYRLPVLLIHYEYFINKTDASARELYLKSGYGQRQLQSILKKTFNSLSSD